jgi:hypothetical protein
VRAAVISTWSDFIIKGSKHQVTTMATSDTNDDNYIANHPATSAIDLHRLSQHSDVEVRMAVADNKNTHIITTAQLAQDDNPDLRYALAENHQIDSGILNILARDENPYVADRAQKTLLRLQQAIPGNNLQKNADLTDQELSPHN